MKGVDVDPMDTNLKRTPVFDHDSPAIAAFVERVAPGNKGPDLRERSRLLYYAVRDGLDYEVFGTDLTDEGLTGSAVLAAGRGFCLHKSILYVTAARRLGVPARLMSSHVRNHLSTPELRELVGGEIFLHWYAEILLEGRWIKVTPVFNALLCRLYRMAPLEFDGEHDAVDHPFDLSGRERMEFLGETLRHEDPSPEEVRALISKWHPAMVAADGRVPVRPRRTAPAPAR
jgi:hypothetical protein